MHILKLSRKGALNKSLSEHFFLFFVSFGRLFIIFTLMRLTNHSSQINRACSLFAVPHKKHSACTPPTPLTDFILPLPSRVVSAPWTATQRSCFMNKLKVSLEQCPCFGAQHDPLLLCNNTHILIDCVPNNYSVRERHYIKL